MMGFDYDASIAYLGPSQLLFAFNPHTLVPRNAAETSWSGKLRLVRAMLIDLDVHKAEELVNALLAKPLGAVSIRDKLTAFAEAEGLPI